MKSQFYAFFTGFILFTIFFVIAFTAIHHIFLLQYIELYMTSSHDHERDRVMQTMKVILQNYLDNATFTVSVF